MVKSDIKHLLPKLFASDEAYFNLLPDISYRYLKADINKKIVQNTRLIFPSTQVLSYKWENGERVDIKLLKY